jgi:hypothetical protein
MTGRTVRERDVVVAVAIGSLCAPICVVLLYGAPFALVSLWPFPTAMLAAGWFLARRGQTLPSRILGTVGLAAVSLIGSTALIEGVVYQIQASS